MRVVHVDKVVIFAAPIGSVGYDVQRAGGVCHKVVFYVLCAASRSQALSVAPAQQQQQQPGSDYNINDMQGVGMDVEPMEGADELIPSLHVRDCRSRPRHGSPLPSLLVATGFIQSSYDLALK